MNICLLFPLKSGQEEMSLSATRGIKETFRGRKTFLMRRLVIIELVIERPWIPIPRDV